MIKKKFHYLLNILNSDESEFKKKRYFLRTIFYIFILQALIVGISFVLMMKSNPKVQVPNLIEKDIIDAVKDLQTLKLTPIIYEKYSGKFSKYKIISQSPKPGSIVKIHREIKILVSKGNTIKKMPNFQGQNIYEAKNILFSQLSTLNITPNIVILRQYSTNFEKDLIIKQKPKQEQIIDFSKDIIFVVSKGIYTNILTVENYKLKDYKDVINKLKLAGINVIIKAKISNNPKYIGKIFSQSVKIGNSLKKGNQIEFIVGIRKETGLSYKNRELLRIYSIFVDKNPKNELKSRRIKIVVHDETGKGTEFNEEVEPNNYIEIPYATIGKGYIDIFIDGKFYESKKFFIE